MFSGDMFLALREGYQMHELCSKCGAHLSTPWRFCPLCGAVIPPQTQDHDGPAEIEKAPVQGAFSGLTRTKITATKAATKIPATITAKRLIIQPPRNMPHNLLLLYPSMSNLPFLSRA